MSEPQTTIAAAPVRAGAEIRLERVSIAFGENRVVSGIDLTVAAGEFVCLLGPSGCGKSTLLNLVAGFLPASAGRVSVGGKPVTGPGMDRGVVFQSTEALFPWLTVQENVEYGPRMRGVSRAERAESARHYVDLVGLTHAANRLPGELSGGMRQRAQIARVLVNEPTVVLMDEPFGALDAQNRRIMQQEVRRIWAETGRTILFVTHSIEEAVAIGTTLIMLSARPARIRELIRNDGSHERGKLIDDLNAMIMEEVQRQQGDAS
jgi:NitT/TauT family transport system ATP-binding protein